MFIWNTNKKDHIHRPIFLVAVGRSGSTALQNALGLHSQVTSSGLEAPIIHRFGDLVNSYFAHDTKKEYYQANLAIDASEFTIDLQKIMYKSAIGNAKLKTKYWITKAFITESSFQGLDIVFPKAKYIFLIRNGIDVIHSRTKFNKDNKVDFERYCINWSKENENYQYLVQCPKSIFIKYEALVDDYKGILQSIYKHIDINSELKPKEYLEQNLVHSLGNKGIEKIDVQSTLQNRIPAYSKWDKWKKQCFKKHCNDTMLNYGYKIPF